MYGNVRRYYYGNRRRTEWQTLSVPVARCSACQEAHKKSDTLGSTFGWIGALIAIVLGIIITMQLVASVPPTQQYDYTTGTYTPAPGDASGMVCLGIFIGAVVLTIFALAGAATGRLIGNHRYIKPAQSRPPLDVKTHPVVAQQLAKGWKIGSKPST